MPDFCSADHNRLLHGIYLIFLSGGYIPKDSPAPFVLTSTLAEQVIAGVLSSFGILSTIFFFSFNVYYSNHW